MKDDTRLRIQLRIIDFEAKRNEWLDKAMTAEERSRPDLAKRRRERAEYWQTKIDELRRRME